MDDPRVAIVSAISAFGQDADTPLLREALDALGIASGHLAWDDPTVSWGRFDAVVLRSPWDYTGRRGAFLEWARRVSCSTRLFNTEPVLTWNTDKRYLAELAASGIAVVDSVFHAPDEPLRGFPDWDEIILKPTVGAGSRGVGRFARADAGRAMAHAAALQADGAHVLMQPYLDAVDTDGETALVYFNGGFSHAVRKAALLDPDGGTRCSLSAPDVITACEAAPGQLALSAAALDVTVRLLGLEQAPLYARVDLLPSAEGPRVLELELTEPSLFLDRSPGAATRFALALQQRLVTSGRPATRTPRR